jgi:hypothetical protein
MRIRIFFDADADPDPGYKMMRIDADPDPGPQHWIEWNKCFRFDLREEGGHEGVTDLQQLEH